MTTNTKRFSDRVEDYIKYRPQYPNQIIDILKDKIGLEKEHTIADIGSGTGISSEPFLKNGNKVFAVEPNTEMKEAAELIYSENSNFISIEGSAEITNLKTGSIDIIFCGQAFHWFNKTDTKIEFNRILNQSEHIILAWNVRDEKDILQKEYEQILRQNIPEYKEVTHKNISDKEINEFLEPKQFHFSSIENFQEFDLEGLKGRLKSSSYCPKEGLTYDRLMNEIETLFYKFVHNGFIRFQYETKMYYC